MSRVFISHAYEDWLFVEKEIRSLLEEHGISSWCSEDHIRGSDDWESCIRHALDDCEWFMVAISQNAARSMWVAREVHWAMEERPTRFVPILLEPCDFTQWHLGIRTLQFVDFTSVTETGRRKLLQIFGASMDEVPNQPLVNATRDFVETGADPQTGSDVEATLSGFDYYCYISETKINQYYDQLDNPSRASPTSAAAVNSRIAEIAKQLALARFAISPEVPGLEKELKRLQTVRNLTSLSFGRSTPSVHRSLLKLENSVSLLQKTRRVLSDIFATGKIVQLSGENELSRRHGGGVFSLFQGEHRFGGYGGPGMAILLSTFGRFELRQYCSMKFFSDMSCKSGPEGQVEVIPHSMNYAFFDEHLGLSYSLASILLVTAVQENVIFGYPLCLILDSRADISL